MDSLERLLQIAAEAEDTIVDVEVGERLRASAIDEKVLVGKALRSDHEKAAVRRRRMNRERLTKEERTMRRDAEKVG